MTMPKFKPRPIHSAVAGAARRIYPSEDALLVDAAARGLVVIAKPSRSGKATTYAVQHDPRRRDVA